MLKGRVMMMMKRRSARRNRRMIIHEETMSRVIKCLAREAILLVAWQPEV